MFLYRPTIFFLLNIYIRCQHKHFTEGVTVIANTEFSSLSIVEKVTVKQRLLSIFKACDYY